MGAYHIGAWSALREHRGAWLAQAPVTGASVGALVGAGIVSDVDPHQLRPVFESVATHVRSLPLGAMTPFLPSLVDYARVELDKALPSDAHERCSGRLFVAVTEVRPKTRVSLRSKFGSREELLDTLIASSFVPGVTGSVAEIPAVNGATAIDGGLVRNWPRLPMNDFHTIHVSPFAGDFAICPPKSLEHATVRFMGAAVQRSPKNLATALHAIFPPAIEGLAEYSDAGYADAVAFLEGHRDEVAGVREDRAQLEGEVRALEGRAV